MTLRDTTVATGPLPEEERGDGSGVGGLAADRSAQVEDDRRRSPRREASSSSFFTAAAVAGVNEGIFRIATSRSQVVEGPGASKRPRVTGIVSRFSSPPRNRTISHEEPSGPSSAALTCQYGALRSGLPSTESMRSPALMPAFSAGEPGSGADDVRVAAAAREDDARAGRARGSAGPCTRPSRRPGRSRRTGPARPTSRRRRLPEGPCRRSARRSWSASGRRPPRRSRGPGSPGPSRPLPGRRRRAAKEGRKPKRPRTPGGSGWISSWRW